MQDNSDVQYRSFRDNVPLLVNAALGYLLIKYIAKRLTRASPSSLHLIPLEVALSLGMILALHGSSAVKLLAILTVNFVLARKFRGSRLGPTFTWIFNGAVLFSVEIFHGYRFGSILPGLAALVRRRASFLY